MELCRRPTRAGSGRVPPSSAGPTPPRRSTRPEPHGRGGRARSARWTREVLLRLQTAPALNLERGPATRPSRPPKGAKGHNKRLKRREAAPGVEPPAARASRLGPRDTRREPGPARPYPPPGSSPPLGPGRRRARALAAATPRASRGAPVQVAVVRRGPGGGHRPGRPLPEHAAVVEVPVPRGPAAVYGRVALGLHVPVADVVLSIRVGLPGALGRAPSVGQRAQARRPPHADGAGGGEEGHERHARLHVARPEMGVGADGPVHARPGRVHEGLIPRQVEVHRAEGPDGL